MDKMCDYISRDDAKNALLNKGQHTTRYRLGETWELNFMEILEALDTIPTADVQPVKHGRWEETHISLCKWIPEDEKEEGHSFYMAEMKCSCCKRYNTVTFVLTLDKPDFCQSCGARMDLGDEKT